MTDGRDRTDVLVVSTTDRGEKITRPLAAVGVDATRFTVRSIDEVPDLLGHIRREDPAVVIVDSLSFAGGTVALAKLLFSVPYVVRIRGDAMSEHRSWFWTHLSRGAYGRALKQIPRYVATRGALKTTDDYLFVSKYLKERYDVEGDRAAVVNTPCFMLEEDLDEVEVTDPLGIDPDRTMILAVTNMNYPGKVEGLVRALDPISTVLSADDDATFVIAGDGPYHERVERRAQALPGDIHVPGYVSEIGPLFKRADIFVHFSLLDGYPSTVLESYASRTPVIANDSVGMSEQVIDGETGYLVDLDAPETIRQRLEQLLHSPAERETLGENGYEYVRENNGTERIGSQFRSYLDPFLE